MKKPLLSYAIPCMLCQCTGMTMNEGLDNNGHKLYTITCNTVGCTCSFSGSTPDAALSAWNQVNTPVY